MKQILASWMLVGLLGCDDFQQAMDGPGRQTTVAPGGVASSGDVSAVQNAASGGAAAPVPAQPVVQPQPVAQPEAQAPAKRSGPIIGKMTARISDAVELRKNPQMVELENKVSGNDPFTASFTAYVSITSRASVANFKHQMDILKAGSDNNSYPPFKEAEKLMKQMRIELSELPSYQQYGYDAKTGTVSVFEDKAEKILRESPK